jgi:hypothetical protein
VHRAQALGTELAPQRLHVAVHGAGAGRVLPVPHLGEQVLTGDFPGGLKDLRTENPEVRAALLAAFAKWIRKNNDISCEQLEKLKAVPLFNEWLNKEKKKRAKSRTFDEGLAEFESFIKENNRLPKCNEINHWWSNLKTKIKNNQLSNEQLEKLLKIPLFSQWYKSN